MSALCGGGGGDRLNKSVETINESHGQAHTHTVAALPEWTTIFILFKPKARR